MYVCMFVARTSHKNSISNFISHLVIKHNPKGNRKIDFFSLRKKRIKQLFSFQSTKKIGSHL